MGKSIPWLFKFTAPEFARNDRKETTHLRTADIWTGLEPVTSRIQDRRFTAVATRLISYFMVP